MITCDLFDLRLEVVQGDRRTIKYELITDLPAGTRVIISCHRRYRNMRNETCLWTGYNEDILLEPNIRGDFNGAIGEIDVEASDSEAIEEFNELLGAFSAGIKGTVGDELQISFIVGGRQPIRAFGKMNCHLRGDMVADEGGVKVVQAVETLDVPMREKYQPIEKSED